MKKFRMIFLAVFISISILSGIALGAEGMNKT